MMAYQYAHHHSNNQFAACPSIGEINERHPHGLTAAYSEDSDEWRGFLTEEGRLVAQFDSNYDDIVYYDEDEEPINNDEEMADEDDCDGYNFAEPPSVNQINYYHPHDLVATYYEDSNGWRGFLTDEDCLVAQYDYDRQDVVYYDQDEEPIDE